MATDQTVDANGAEQNHFRREIVAQIFGDVGELADVDFSCAIESTILIHGRLYLSNTALLFYSNLFGIEKKVKIPYSRVKSFAKAKTALLIPNAIQIVTKERTYYFRSFLDRERCIQLLSHYMPTPPAAVSAAADGDVEAFQSETDDAAAAVKKTVFQKVIAAPLVAVSAVGKAGGAVGRLITGAGRSKKSVVKGGADEQPSEEGKEEAGTCEEQREANDR